MNYRGRNFQLLIVIPFLLFLFIVSCSLAEEPFVCDRTPIYSLSFANENTGWAVGECGTVLKTEDGGETWQEQESQTTAWLESAFFINEQIGWAVGWNGFIMKTDDGGINWQIQNSGTQETLYDIYFVDELKGWASGGDKTVLKTIDGGQTWEIITSVSGQNTIYSIYFLDENIGWAVGSGDTRLTTDDGGDRWHPIAINPNFRGVFQYVEFVEDQTGFMFGARYDPPGASKSGKSVQTVLKTSNGGKNWDEYIISRWEWGQSPYVIYSADFMDIEIGWAIGYGDRGSAVYETTDGGETWQLIREYPEIELTAIYATNSEQVLVAGGKDTPEYSQSSVILDVKEGIQLYP